MVGQVRNSETDWVRVLHQDPSNPDGKVEYYYWNKKSNETSWDEPPGGWAAHQSDMDPSSTTDLDVSDMELRTSGMTKILHELISKGCDLV